jgi:Zn-dependent protease with chaperone function/Tfp pilus assembly major pilin PilA
MMKKDSNNHLVYAREPLLGGITLTLGLLLWLALLLGTFGLVLVVLALAGLGYLFAQSALFAHVRGNGVLLSQQQYPQLHSHLRVCCERLQLSNEPEVYVLHGSGWLNAFAARFLGTHMVVLLSDVVDAMESHPDGVRFYIGHELGHIQRGHLTGKFWRLPALWIPLLGAAYSRAKQSTCDLHGLVCCTNRENCARALAAFAVGPNLWQQLNLKALTESQLPATRGFWMGYHELTRGYPWLSKRIARVLRQEIPSRHPLSWLPALFTPFGGRRFGVAGPLAVVALIGALAAVAAPAYETYRVKAQWVKHLQQAVPVQERLVRYFESTGQLPTSLASLGQQNSLQSGAKLRLNPQNMVLIISQDSNSVVLIPRKANSGSTEWHCQPVAGSRLELLPPACQGPVVAR